MINKHGRCEVCDALQHTNFCNCGLSHYQFVCDMPNEDWKKYSKQFKINKIYPSIPVILEDESFVIKQDSSTGYLFIIDKDADPINITVLKSHKDIKKFKSKMRTGDIRDALENCFI